MRAYRTIGSFSCAALGMALLATAGISSGRGPTPAWAQSDEQKDSKDAKEKRPSFSVKATPPVSISPARVVATAELKGGADDYEEYYCPTVEWEWGDGTKSQSTIDCEPYESGKSVIKRRFTADHTYHMGSNYRIHVRLKRANKTVVATTTTVQVRPGLREPIY